MYRVTLTDQQRLELHRRAHTRDVAPNVRDRLEMLRLADKGWSIPKIALHLGQHEQTVRYWIKAFLAADFDALHDKPHGGKSSELTPAMMEALIGHIRASQQTWTAPQLAAWVAEQYQVHLSPGRLRVHLKRADLSYKRTSRSLKHKQKTEEVAAKEVSLETLQKGAMPN